jgi:uncharacterized protein (TIGR02246 family)
MNSEIGKVLRDQVEAWNHGDLERFCSYYASDAVYLMKDGPVQGRENIRALYRSRFGRDMGHLTVLTEAIDLVGDAAFVQVRWTIDEATGVALLGFRKEPEGWRIAWDATL